MFGKKKINKENYVEYLEKEVDKLKGKIAVIEKERDNALSSKKRTEDMLNRYKKEYESLIEDSKKLVAKQKKTEETMDKIISDCRDELERLTINKK